MLGHNNLIIVVTAFVTATVVTVIIVATSPSDALLLSHHTYYRNFLWFETRLLKVPIMFSAGLLEIVQVVPREYMSSNEQACCKVRQNILSAVQKRNYPNSTPLFSGSLTCS